MNITPELIDFTWFCMSELRDNHKTIAAAYHCSEKEALTLCEMAHRKHALRPKIKPVLPQMFVRPKAEYSNKQWFDYEN